MSQFLTVSDEINRNSYLLTFFFKTRLLFECTTLKNIFYRKVPKVSFFSKLSLRLFFAFFSYYAKF